ncbi:hypothetical protein BJI67_12920 [Acidihalobacter aeolianus]|uniref:Uncharacterized protein n=1 Tax=Acidihalobacter aeolianus TaxID=2792603 RepID=A0A1D8KA64_9GAMM|nr:hypothetical protein [Acidihalobacter aeolianus]AOV17834.1 hypothetical protein BJI67_12920 [Acidihalobacter aeolianus]
MGAGLILDLIRGFAWGLGFAVARVLWLPILIALLGLGGWAWGWAAIHHLPFVMGARHVAGWVDHAGAGLVRARWR